ncbi:hypothetical protein [Oryzobacter telluris]|uniref:hypothetical protein n=1 Tax=Oryzobacter telluris TaxID=3149179 RepID=UPI00370D6B72
MGFLDRLLGRPPRPQEGQAVGRGPTSSGWGAPSSATPAPPASGPSEDERAVARYRYLLRTAPPEQLEAIHREAFEKLTPDQREQLLRELASQAPEEAGTSAEPADLARAATRAEMRRPGTLQGTFSRGSFAGGGMGMGGMVMGSMMGTIAGVVVGSAIANALFDGYDQSPEAQEAGDTGSDSGDSGDTGGDSGDTGGDAGQDAGAVDTGSSDTGGDVGGGGDWAGGGSDWGNGGGDFGGGDFGGGDFGGF